MAYARFTGRRWVKYGPGERFEPSEVYILGTRDNLECCACRVLGKVRSTTGGWYWGTFTTTSRWAMLRHIKRHRRRGHAVPRSAISRLLRDIKQVGDEYEPYRGVGDSLRRRPHTRHER